MPSPSILLGFVIAILLATLGGYTKGHHDAANSYKIESQKEEIKSAAALKAKTDEVIASNQKAVNHLQKLEVTSAKLKSTTNDLAAANSLSTWRLLDKASLRAGEGKIGATGNSVNNPGEAQWVFPISLEAIKRLDQLTLEADQINDAYSICRKQ